MLYNIRNFSVKFVELPDAASAEYPAEIEKTNVFPFSINVQKDQDMKVTFKWQQYRSFAGVDLSKLIEFECEVMFEKMGPGTDKIFSKTVPFTKGINHWYVEDLVIPANKLEAGVFKVLVLFKAGIPGGAPDDKYVAAFQEIGIANIYKAD